MMMSIRLGHTFEEYVKDWEGVNKSDRTCMLIKSPLEINVRAKILLNGFDIEQMRKSVFAEMYYHYLSELNAALEGKEGLVLAADYIDLEPVTVAA